MNTKILGLFLGPIFILACSSSTKYEESFRAEVKTMLIEHKLKKGGRNIIFKGRAGTYKSEQKTYHCLQYSKDNNVEVEITLFPGTFQIKDCKYD